MTDEKPVVDEALNSGHCTRVFCGRRTNDRNRRELSVDIGEEVCWFGHDQVGLERIPLERFRIRLSLGGSEIRKGNGGFVYLIEVG